LVVELYYEQKVKALDKTYLTNNHIHLVPIIGHICGTYKCNIKGEKLSKMYVLNKTLFLVNFKILKTEALPKC